MADSGTNPVRPNTFELEADVNVEFNEAASRQQINSGESVKTLFGKIRKFLADLKAVAFSGAYSDLSGTPDLSRYASKSKYGDTTIDVGRKAGTTVGEYSTAEGSGTTASGNFSHTEGSDTTASGNGSHSEGGNSIASGSFSHAEGADTTASNYSSHAGGSVSEASGRYSFSHGNRTQALHESEVAFGQNNISNDDTLFSIGDGAYNARHNAFEITTTGGKLHDKDIAVKDDIPTELPANGGNADTVDGLHASDFVRAFNSSEMDNNRILIPNDVHVGNWLRANAEIGMQYYRYPGCSGQTGLPDGANDWVWFLYDGLTYMAKTVYNRFFIMDYINSYNGWLEIYTSNSKPYISGSATVAANSTTCTSNHGFTPSAVIWWDGSLSGVAVSFSDTQFVIDKTNSVGRTINYLIFK